MNLTTQRTRLLPTRVSTPSGAILVLSLLIAMLTITPGAWASDPAAVAAAIAAPAAASLHVSVLNKAPFDECFDSIGSVNNVYLAPMPCAIGGPKVNGGYIWGMTSSGHNIWYGTVANTLCTVISGILSTAMVPLTPFETSSMVCEFDDSNFLVSHPTVPPALGDWRPPKILSYEQTTGIVTDRTPNDPLINQTLGLRSAGAIHDLVILAGPALAPFGTLPTGINLFAFQNSTGKYLGSTTLTQYTDIRSWTTLNVPAPMGDPKFLYAGVQNRAMGGGSVLRWTGTVSNPFTFVVVGSLDNEPAYLAVASGRIFATTWGGINSSSHLLSGLWASPKVGLAGLYSSSATKWKEIWRIDDYEADPVTAQTLIGGAIGVYGGQVYWGTMQVPLTGALAHYNAFPTKSIPLPGDAATTVINTTRPVAIFRCCKGGTSLNSPNIQLLYGDSLMEVYSTANGWQTVPNNMGVEPKFGSAGFGNPFNTYAWSAATFNNRLYFGTFDWSYVAVDLITELAPTIQIVDPMQISQIVTQVLQVLNPVAFTYGADLWTFGPNGGAATPESLYGVGNYLNYGIRTMVPTRSNLYIGTANPMNLRTDSTNPPLGGYELLGLHP